MSWRLTSYRNIYFKPKKAGGLKITFQNPPKNLDEKMIYNVLRDYKILNGEVLVRDEYGMLYFYYMVNHYSHLSSHRR